jgi:hypothetical protein
MAPRDLPSSAMFFLEYSKKFPAPATGGLFARCLVAISSQGPLMHLDIVMIQPLVALLFGILILILPRLLNYLIAIYLILVGLAGLFPHVLTTTVST